MKLSFVCFLLILSLALSGMTTMDHGTQSGNTGSGNIQNQSHNRKG